MFKHAIHALIPAFFIAGHSAQAQHVQVEPGAVIAAAAEMPNSTLLWMVDPAVEIIRASGHPCDSVSEMRPASVFIGLTVVCNSSRYAYDIEDQDGRWQVVQQ